MLEELTILTLKAWPGWTVRIGIDGGLEACCGLEGVGTIFNCCSSLVCISSFFSSCGISSKNRVRSGCGTITGLGVEGIVVGAIVTILGESDGKSGVGEAITLVLLAVLVVSAGTVGMVGIEGVVEMTLVSLGIVVVSVGMVGVLCNIGFSDSNKDNIEGNGVGSVSSNGILRRKVSQIGSGFMCNAWTLLGVPLMIVSYRTGENFFVTLYGPVHLA